MLYVIVTLSRTLFYVQRRQRWGWISSTSCYLSKNIISQIHNLLWCSRTFNRSIRKCENGLATTKFIQSLVNIPNVFSWIYADNMLRIIIQGFDSSFDLIKICFNSSGDNQIIVGNLLTNVFCWIWNFFSTLSPLSNCTLFFSGSKWLTSCRIQIVFAGIHCDWGRSSSSGVLRPAPANVQPGW